MERPHVHSEKQLLLFLFLSGIFYFLILFGSVRQIELTYGMVWYDLRQLLSAR